MEVIQAIEEAKTDNDIEGISILNSYSQLEWLRVKRCEMLCAVLEKSGIAAYSNAYSQKEYLPQLR
jgi:protease-4